MDDVQDASAEDVKDEEQAHGAEDTVEYWKAQALKHKAIAERKDKKLQEQATKASPVNKNNTEQSAPTLEHMALLAKGASVEQIKQAEQIAKLQGVDLTSAYNSDLAQSLFAEEKRKQEANRNSLGASSGSAPAAREKTVENMTADEHRAYAENLLKNAVNR